MDFAGRVQLNRLNKLLIFFPNLNHFMSFRLFYCRAASHNVLVIEPKIHSKFSIHRSD